MLSYPLIIQACSIYYLVKSSNTNNSKENGLSQEKGLQIIKEPPGLKNYGNTCFINSILQAKQLKFVHNFIGFSIFTTFPEVHGEISKIGS